MVVTLHFRIQPLAAHEPVQHVTDMVTDTGQKSDRQKVAMRLNGWLYKIILPVRSLILISSFNLRHHTNPISPPANVTPDFQKRNKKEIHFQNA